MGTRRGQSLDLSRTRRFIKVKKLITALMILLCVPAFADSSLTAPTTNNSKLKKAIKMFSPDASLLISSDLDTSSCGNKKNPGMIEGDFSGDGQKDYAVLLKIRKVEDTVYKSDGNSYPWKKLKVWLVDCDLQVGQFS